VICDLLIFSVLCFASLAWGGNEPWSMAVIACGSVLALALRLSWDAFRGSLRLTKTWLLAPLALYPAYVGMQAVHPLTGYPESRSLLPFTVEPHTTGVYFLLLLSYSCITIAVAIGFESRRSIRWFMLGIVGLGVFQAVYGLIQYLGDYKYIWDYPISGNIARGTIINRNHYSLFLNLSLSAGLGYLYFRSIRLLHGENLKIRRIISSPGSGKLAWMLLWLAVCGLALVMSMSRMGILAMFAALFVMLVAGKASERGKRTAVLGLSLLFAIVGLALYTGIDAVLERFEKVSDSGYFEKDRLPIWQDAWRMIGHQPATGTGLGTFRWTFPAYESFEPDVPARYAHNDYLQTLAETGLPGLAILLTAFVICWKEALSNLNGSDDPLIKGIGLTTLGILTAAALQEITDFSLYTPGVALCFAALAGLNLRAARLRRSEKSSWSGDQHPVDA
jgi:O-antigen ligase